VTVQSYFSDKDRSVRRLLVWAMILPLCIIAASCALLPPGTIPPIPDVVTVSPQTAPVRAGATQQFSASVPHVSNPIFSWSVNGTVGGSATAGTIDSTGLYTAPTILPAPNTVTINAALTIGTQTPGNSTVTLLNPIPVLNGVLNSPIAVGPFYIVLTGSNFVPGSTVSFGGTTLTTTYSSNGELAATGTATSAQLGSVPVTVQNPDPGSASSSAVNATVVAPNPVVAPEVADRFLEQSSFGPNAAYIAQVQQLGLQGFLNAQYSLPVTPFPNPAASETDLSEVQKRFYVQIVGAPDQLRQRVAYALGLIYTISGNTISTPQAFTPYLQLLQNDAFANYRQIMEDVTLSPAMGNYLNMVNNNKPYSSSDHANENYARELMQLFTLGTSLLNQDGSLQTDGSGNQIATYSQAQVQEFALAYTGWTYPTQPGMATQTNNPQYWIGPMVAVNSNHDVTVKQLLQYAGAVQGGLLPAGQTAQADLDGALDNIFNHPNMPPFVSQQLIQHLVTSNPSPAYVQRVASVFANNGNGVRGDMAAVVTAILLDPEARRGDSPATANAVDGHLREPTLYIAGLLRAFNGVTDGANLDYYGGTMGEAALEPGSVFSFFSPSFQIPGTSLLGPEFQIQTTATALNRFNWLNSFAFGSIGSTTTVDFSPYANQASNPAQMLASLNTLMMHGTMSANVQNSILTAVAAVPAGSNQAMDQAKTAIYLVATSSQYQVAH
jgi:uncharacterized protein (DUF1800 family)